MIATSSTRVRLGLPIAVLWCLRTAQSFHMLSMHSRPSTSYTWAHTWNYRLLWLVAMLWPSLWPQTCRRQYGAPSVLAKPSPGQTLRCGNSCMWLRQACSFSEPRPALKVRGDGGLTLGRSRGEREPLEPAHYGAQFCHSLSSPLYPLFILIFVQL